MHESHLDGIILDLIGHLPALIASTLTIRIKHHVSHSTQQSIVAGNLADTAVEISGSLSL